MNIVSCYQFVVTLTFGFQRRDDGNIDLALKIYVKTTYIITKITYMYMLSNYVLLLVILNIMTVFRL